MGGTNWTKRRCRNAFANQGAADPWWKKKDPGILPALRRILEDDTAGDPCSIRKWKRQSLDNLVEKLGPQHAASAPTVARLLRELDYSPKVNRKHLGESSPDRDRQFQYILGQKRLFLRHGWPIVSVDAKKRELVGWFKNAGQAWCREAFAVNLYDYPSLAEGIAIPYGLYDLVHNEGFVSLGISANTADFAVASVWWWWHTYGQYRYPDVPALLVLGDGGSNNGCRVHLWKYALQTQFVNRTGLEVTVCHYPTGASKWNPVEHRLFGQISKNWQGYPLFSYARMLAMIRGTETETGLKVHARLDRRTYVKGKELSEQQMLEINLHAHRIFPKWNYTLKPRLPL